MTYPKPRVALLVLMICVVNGPESKLDNSPSLLYPRQLGYPLYDVAELMLVSKRMTGRTVAVAGRVRCRLRGVCTFDIPDGVRQTISLDIANLPTEDKVRLAQNCAEASCQESLIGVLKPGKFSVLSTSPDPNPPAPFTKTAPPPSRPEPIMFQDVG